VRAGLSEEEANDLVDEIEERVGEVLEGENDDQENE
jgi:hypothetical protein